MKKGDLVRRECARDAGHTLCSGFTSVEQAEAWMQSQFTDHYSVEATPPYQIVLSDGKYNIITTQPFLCREDYKVMWVLVDEASLESLAHPGAFIIIPPNSEEFKVFQESAPSFQSQVINMSDAELKASIDALRAGRIIPEPIAKAPKPAKAGTPSHGKDDAYDTLLAQMTPAERDELRKKMGLV